MEVLFLLQPIFEALRVVFGLVAMGTGVSFILVFLCRIAVDQKYMKKVIFVFFAAVFLAVAISPLVEIEKVQDNIAYWLEEQEIKERK